VNEIMDKLREEHAVRPHAVEALRPGSKWVVLDFTDVIVHVMRGDVRTQYDLEGLWGDAPRVKPARRRKARPAAAVTSPPVA
jgi:ribosome-associated protein